MLEGVAELFDLKDVRLNSIFPWCKLAVPYYTPEIVLPTLAMKFSYNLCLIFISRMNYVLHLSVVNLDK